MKSAKTLLKLQYLQLSDDSKSPRTMSSAPSSAPSAPIVVTNYSRQVSQVGCFRSVGPDAIKITFPGLLESETGSPESVKYFFPSRDGKRVAWQTEDGTWWLYVP